MRAFAVYFGVIGLMIWLASDGHLDRLSSRFGGELPIGGASAPLAASIEDLPDAEVLNSLSIVPAAVASDLRRATVTGAVVNLRAGPGLSYRMVDVATRGQSVLVEGVWVNGWAPVFVKETGLSAWVHGDYITEK